MVPVPIRSVDLHHTKEPQTMNRGNPQATASSATQKTTSAEKNHATGCWFRMPSADGLAVPTATTMPWSTASDEAPNDREQRCPGARPAEPSSAVHEQPHDEAQRRAPTDVVEELREHGPEDTNAGC